jgi:hypothetical protein
MDNELKRILYAQPVRSLREDPILTKKITNGLSEKDLRELDLIKQAKL